MVWSSYVKREAGDYELVPISYSEAYTKVITDVNRRVEEHIDSTWTARDYPRPAFYDVVNDCHKDPWGWDDIFENLLHAVDFKLARHLLGREFVCYFGGKTEFCHNVYDALCECDGPPRNLFEPAKSAAGVWKDMSGFHEHTFSRLMRRLDDRTESNVQADYEISGPRSCYDTPSRYITIDEPTSDRDHDALNHLQLDDEESNFYSRQSDDCFSSWDESSCQFPCLFVLGKWKVRGTSFQERRAREYGHIGNGRRRAPGGLPRSSPPTGTEPY
jgi:hypothetical protein